MTLLRIITPIFLLGIFILLHYLFNSNKRIKNEKELENKKALTNVNNYKVIEVFENNFIAIFIPTNKFIYISNDKGSILSCYATLGMLCNNEQDATHLLTEFLNNIK